MTAYERLEQCAYENDIALFTHPLPVKGIYYANGDFKAIALNSGLETSGERCAVLAHELGHYYTKPPDLFVCSKALQDRYEQRAALWAACELVTLPELVRACRQGVRTAWELSEYLGVTEDFLARSLDLLEEKYGPCARCQNYVVYFHPLIIKEVI